MHIDLLSDDLALLRRWEEALKDLKPRETEGITPVGSPKVVVADLSTKGREVLDFLKHPNDEVRLLALEGRPTFENGRRLLAVGVRGYGNAWMQPVHLRSAVETVATGNVWVYPEFVDNLLAQMGRSVTTQPRLPDVLTEREKEIAQRVLEGRSNREIAEELGITERTVKAHLGNVYEKLHVRNRLQLASLLRGH